MIAVMDAFVDVFCCSLKYFLSTIVLWPVISQIVLTVSTMKLYC